MRKFLSVFLSFFILTGSVQAQENNDLKVIPPSPSVAELGRYGLASANLTDGAFATQITLYEYKTKNLSMPITLSYSTNGLKVDKVASRVGMDWSLMAGGSIGRMVLGAPDELKTWASFPASWPATTGDSLTNFINSVTGGLTETVPDIYNFNFNGYSGRFLYMNNQIIKLEQNSLDIKKSSGGFTVTDNGGIRYFFNDTEESHTYSSCSGHPYSQENWLTTAWMLSKIIHPLGDTIYFKYKDCEFTYSAGVNETYTSANEGQSIEALCIQCPAKTASVKCISTIENHGLLLDKIYSNYRGLIQFNYTERFDLEGDSAVSQIKVFDAASNSSGSSVTYYNDTPIKYFSLEYSFPEAVEDYLGPLGINITKRMYLRLYQECEYTSGLCKSYLFDYNKLDSLPRRLTFSQDHFGYFNGKDNESLIPIPANSGHYTRFLPYGYGDRRPDWRYALKGCLSKITYPTLGTDSIVYESHTVYNGGTPNCSELYVTKVAEADGNSELKKVHTYYSDVFTVNCTQSVDILVGNITLSGTMDYPIHNYLTTACLIDGNGPIPSNPGCVGYIGEAGPDEWNSYHVTLYPGTYRLQIKVQGPSRGHANFTFQDNDEIGNVNISGVRVKKVMTKPAQNAIPLERRYYYNAPNSTESSGNTVNQFPNYRNDLSSTVKCTPTLSYPCTAIDCYYSQYSSSNFYSLYSYGGNHIYYNTVTEDLGNNFGNGYVEHHFQVAHDQNATSITGEHVQKGSPLGNFGMLNGKEYLTKYYENTGENFRLVKQVRKSYKSDSTLAADVDYYAFTSNPGFPGCQIAITGLSDYQGLYIAKYTLISRWIYPDSTFTTEYDNKGNQIVTVKIDSFGNPTHLQLTKSETIDSKGSHTITRLYYPSDNVTYTDPSANAARDSLIARHMFSSSLKGQNYLGNVLFKEVENNYSNSFLDVPVLSKVYETKRGNSKELQMQINGYGRGGAILDVTSKGSDRMSFLWDYKQSLPIAQVINASAAGIAYTSFEADGKGNWVFSGSPVEDLTAPTGEKVFFLNGELAYVSKDGLSDGNTYIVSYWSKDGPQSVLGGSSDPAVAGRTANGWTYYEHTATPNYGVISVVGDGYIDELRLYPRRAVMTTYTYDPLIGMTSECDGNNVITYYEYDDMRRLKMVRDQNKNVVKKICYNYAGQPENCNGIITYYNAPISDTFTSVCGTDSIGTVVTYTVAAHTYSSTISQAYVDSMAQADVNANGQSYANANGTCYSNFVNLTSEREGILINYKATYHNNITGLDYVFTIVNSSGIQSLGTVPAGTYTVTIAKTGGTASLTFGVYDNSCSYLYSSGTTATFYNVTVSNMSECNGVLISALD